MLKNSLKISDTTDTESFELKPFQYDQKILQTYCRDNLGSVSDALTCYLSINVPTWRFLGI